MSNHIVLATVVHCVAVTIFPIAVASFLASLVGLWIAWTERTSQLRWAPLVSILVVSLLTYPRAISTSTFFLLLSKISSEFATSPSGLAILLLPNSIALAYLIFSAVFRGNKAIDTAIAYSRNAMDMSVIFKLIVISQYTYAWFFRIMGITICLSMFQATLAGPPRPVFTLGEYLARSLGTNTVSAADAGSAFLVALAFVIVFAFVVPLLASGLWFLLIRFVVRNFGRAVQRSPQREARVYKFHVVVVTAIVLVVMLALHSILLLRLTGALGSVFDEQTWPTLNVNSVVDVLQATIDFELYGAALGAATVIGFWFWSIDKDLHLAVRTIRAVLPGLLALAAFFPSAFLGAVALNVSAIPVPIVRLVWGYLVSLGLSGLLLFPVIFSARATRYDNLLRLSSRIRAIWTFVREHFRIIVSASLLGVFFVATDAGMLQKLGNNASISGEFLSNFKNWSSDVRGVACIVCALMLIFIGLLQDWSKVRFRWFRSAHESGASTIGGIGRRVDFVSGRQ